MPGTDSPFETTDVGGTETEFAGTFYHEQTFGELLLQLFDNGSSPIGRTVFDDEYMEYFFQPEYGADDIFDVLFLVIRGDDNDAVALLHIMMGIDFIYKRKGNNYYIIIGVF